MELGYPIDVSCLSSSVQAMHDQRLIVNVIVSANESLVSPSLSSRGRRLWFLGEKQVL